MPASQPLYLLDASIYIFRSYFSLPDNWHSPEGYPVNALYGYSRFLLNWLDQQQPEYIAAAFDESLGTCFRNDIYPAYKATRLLPDEELAFQLAGCQALTEVLGIQCFASPRYEADDIIATLAVQAQKKNQPVVILSRDKDLGQLLVGDDQCWDPAEDKRMRVADFTEQFGITPEQMIDYQALLGDSIDDVPGVPGVGKKTAAALLNEFGSLEQIYSDLEAVAQCGIRGAKSLSVKLADYKDQVMMARELVRLERTMPLPNSAISLGWQRPDYYELEAFFEEFGLETLSRQLGRYSWLQTD